MKKLQMPAHQSPTLQECIKSFERHCIAGNLSEHTLATYKAHCGKFAAFVGQDGISVGELPQDVTEGFVAYLKQDHKCSDATVQSYMRTVRVFLYYCMELEYMPAYKIKLPKAEKSIKQTCIRRGGQPHKLCAETRRHDGYFPCLHLR